MTSDSPQLQRALFGYRPAGVRQILAGRESMFRFAQERAQTAESKVDELRAERDAARAELDAARVELMAQAEAAEATQTQTRAELQEATGALREQIERAATVDAELSQVQAELAVARQAAQQHADAMRELADAQRELEAARPELAARTEQARSAETRNLELQGELAAARAELAERTREPETAPMAQAEDLSLMLDAAERGVTDIMERARRAYEDQLAQAESVREVIQADIERFGDWQGHVEPLIRSVQHGIETARGRIVRIPDQIREAVDSMTDAMLAVSDSLDRLATLPGPLSAGSLPGAEESLGTPVGGVPRQTGAEPGSSDTVILPSGTPEAESSEADGRDVWFHPERSAEAGDHPREITR